MPKPPSAADLLDRLRRHLEFLGLTHTLGRQCYRQHVAKGRFTTSPTPASRASGCARHLVAPAWRSAPHVRGAGSASG
jgi:hypothetical protein